MWNRYLFNFMAKHGASSVTAIDIDPRACKNVKENAHRNKFLSQNGPPSEC